MLVCVLLGPESDGSRFEQARVGFQSGAGAAYGAELVDGKQVEHSHEDQGEEKNVTDHVEQVNRKV